ncbi:MULTISPECIES: LLM class flavin-dependent oxidoreductase [unclassified Sinorhizobium]|uniref:LLM class flavin-dependent oxidoreductase n=1 Tax=unclassified Sinorhizobium TaxID=2613772 RepID=UPI0035265FEF
MVKHVLFSILDFAPVRAGETVRDALHQTVQLARLAEMLGFRRFWVPEHHGIPLMGSAATAVVIAHIAAQTSKIRVGSGGVMLPNHSPLVVAEQFGTLECLHHGRIDLGIGRSSGSATPAIAKALRYTPEARDRFPDDVRELQSLFAKTMPDQAVEAVPGAGLEIPIWLLGSSTFSAQQAAMLGLPFVFATQIGHDELHPALDAYRSNFKPSATLASPYAMICSIAVAADTDEIAETLFSSAKQLLIGGLRKNHSDLLQPPRDFSISDEEKTMLEKSSRHAIVGSAETVERRIRQLIQATEADELMFLSFIHDLTARQRSLEILSHVQARIGG